MAALLLVTVLALLCPARVQPAGVLELRVLSTLGGPGGPCGGPPSCRLIFRLCLRPPRGVGCSLGVAHSPPGPPPAPGAPRILRLPFAFPWPGTVSLIIESWQLEESKGSGGPRGRLLGRTLARQHLSPGGPWRGGAGGGLRFGTRVRCRPPSRGPRCTPRCPPCTHRCPLACRPPRRCWPPCCAHWGCQEACAPPGTDSNTCTNGGTCTGHGGDSPGTRCDTPGLGRAPEALAAPAAPAAVLAAPAVAPMAPMVALEAPVAPVVALEAPVAAPVAPAAPATAPETSIPAFSASLLPDGGQLAMPEPLPEVPPSPCALGPCFNGGACAPAPGTGYTCRCPPGFRGFNCERRADRCDDHLCLHGRRQLLHLLLHPRLHRRRLPTPRRRLRLWPLPARGHLLHPFLWPRLRLPPRIYGVSLRGGSWGASPGPPAPASCAPRPGLRPPPRSAGSRRGVGAGSAAAAAADGGEPNARDGGWPWHKPLGEGAATATRFCHPSVTRR
ncbi:delta-like protein 3 isoform X2 [Athene noctua]|uniref:delta-like protein 3 isoform X2 n=1 Tax=Athene noctua TaxID=126797 RepID=UPI003EC10735